MKKVFCVGLLFLFGSCELFKKVVRRDIEEVLEKEELVLGNKSEVTERVVDSVWGNRDVLEMERVFETVRIEAERVVYDGDSGVFSAVGGVRIVSHKKKEEVKESREVLDMVKAVEKSESRESGQSVSRSKNRLEKKVEKQKVGFVFGIRWFFVFLVLLGVYLVYRKVKGFKY